MKVYGVVNGEKREPTDEECLIIVRKLQKAVGRVFYNVDISFEERADDSKATA
ncbi:hypothetical protein [Halocella sp. SP3-1]|uniref:hypothetical protein n=1 Tax=Halocella sp. SP3-1 TaxID=2382161 RepID=UPI00197A870D|nr:hypothetical protein [Halocella sp. SP3-1]